MLRAYNPRYNYADVVAVTGKAVDAIGTISYLQPITEVSATVQ